MYSSLSKMLSRKPDSNVEETSSSSITSKSGGNSWKQLPTTSNASCEQILRSFSSFDNDSVLQHLNTTESGLTKEESTSRRKYKGRNLLSAKKPKSWWQLALSVIPTPFNILLFVIAIISSSIPQLRDWSVFTVIMITLILSCVVQFSQDYRSNAAANKSLSKLVATVEVRRKTPDGFENIMVDIKDLVPGDILCVSPGDVIPADCLLLHSSNLSVSQSSFTGENEPQHKCHITKEVADTVFDLQNVLFMQTSVISGSGVAVVLRTGDDAFLATIMKELNKKRPESPFQRGIRQVSCMMLGFMAILDPIVVVINGKTTGNWKDAAYFGIAVAVGLVPEMLPAIVNTVLAYGVSLLRKKGAIVKTMHTVQDLGNMTVLCSDKTGTLTKDEVTLCEHLYVTGAKDNRVLQLAYINATHQSGKKNSIDAAILNHPEPDDQDFSVGEKLQEIPFNFESRRSSCIIRRKDGTSQLICKGALEEVLSLSTHMHLGGRIVLLDDQNREGLVKRAHSLNAEGYRVILVATRELRVTLDFDERFDYCVLESNLVIEGLLTFLDPPKDDAKESIARLQSLGVEVKILTGDNIKVATKVCRSLELVKEVEDEHPQAITGPELEKLKGTPEFGTVVKNCKIFAKLTPAQKGEVITGLKSQGEVVGMLGDGINDCIALRQADCGISVDTGTNVAKECADMILVDKALSIMVDAVLIGRRTQGNTIKYIKLVISGSFGNVFSVLIASLWLPYTPMVGRQLLLQNLLYDFSQFPVASDNLDEEYLAKPQPWDIRDLIRYVVIIGPLSCTADIATFAINWYYYGIRSAKDETQVALAQTHWFLQGLLTQTLIVHVLRTRKLPFVNSRASRALCISTGAVMVIGFVLPYISFAHKFLGFVTPEPTFVGFLALALFGYCALMEISKRVYFRMFGRWL